MELRHLRYFIAVAEERHFGRAASRLAMAQPPLSMQIKSLEQELGVALFHRGPRGVVLTPAGEAFLPGAYEAIAVTARAADAARRAAAGELGELRIGFVSSAAFGPLPEAVRHFADRHPDVALKLEELSTDIQLRGLLAGTLDVGFFRVGIDFIEAPLDPALGIEAIAREPFVMALPADHQLAAQAAVCLADVRDEAFVNFPRAVNPSLHDQISRYCLAAGFVPRFGQEVRLMQTIISLVAAGLGVALVPASLQRLRRDGVIYRPLVDADVASLVVAVSRLADAPPSLPRFMAIVREALNPG
jgi:DNA-binding transcriptional LysR family regulator